MSFKLQLFGITIVSAILLAMAPTPAYAQSYILGGSLKTEETLTDCLAAANGDREAFIECIREQEIGLQEQYGLSGAWFDTFITTVEHLTNWVGFAHRTIDRIENHLDRSENRWDRRENRWDRREKQRDRREDRWDLWEDAHDDQIDREDIFDRLEDRLDRWEDYRDQVENRWDRWEDLGDR